MAQYRTYIDRPCEICGKLFNTRKDGTVKTCSKECLSMYRKIKANLIRNCINCGKEFIAKKQERKCCSNKCAAEERSKNKIQILNCDYCGEEFKRPNCHVNDNHNFCSSDCRNKYTVENSLLAKENHPNWNNGETTNNGYRFKRIDKAKYRAKHRLIMEKAIGRELRSDEIVHHKDGNKLNNALENLEIVTRAEHINIHRDSLYGNRKAGIVQAEVWIGG